MRKWNCWCTDYKTHSELAREVIEAEDGFDAIRRFRSRHAAAQKNGVAVYIVKRGMLDRLRDLFRKEQTERTEGTESNGSQ